VISRFHNREFLLDHDGARDRYLHCLEVACSRTDVRVFAYCLMSSHVHLVLQLGTTRLGAFTRAVNTSWVNWLNKRYGRLGTAMAERPNSVFCDTETYALDLVRYVHNNPVRAKVVSSSEESYWSSHRAYLGLDESPEWLESEPVLYRLSDDIGEARGKFAAFVEDGKFEPRRPEFSGKVSREMSKRIRGLVRGPVEISYPVLGPDDFILQVFGKQEKENIDRAQFSNVFIGAMDVLEAVCRETGLKKGQFLGKSRLREVTRGRKLAAWVWCERFGRPQIDIAEMFGVNPSAVSKMMRDT
jgi:putative transposase